MDRPVIFNCHHGMRSMQAVSWLRQQGYDNVTNLHGGIDLWSQEIDSSVARY
jgi:rhodanese-related sulfurtransferase